MLRSLVRRLLLSFFVITLAAALASTSYGGIVGVFQGRIVLPQGAKAEEGILYVRARNGMARKVKVEKAVVVEYDEDVPKRLRRKVATQSLCEDTLVRVTAEQSEKEGGEWKAISILILADAEVEASEATRSQKASFFQEREGKRESGSGLQPPPATKGRTSGTNGFCAR